MCVAGRTCPSFSSPVLQGYTPRGSVGDEQPAAHVLLALRVQFPEGLYVRAQIVGEALCPVLVDLDKVARGIADVELHHVPRQVHEMVAKGGAIERAAPLGNA